MFKLISILIALIPVFLLLRSLVGRSATMKRAVADFKKQIDFLVWVILLMTAAAIIYSVVTLVLSIWR
jgi:hypothetical protein